MNITIGNYRITSDSRNVSVHEVSIVPELDGKGNENKRAGEERLDLVGHHPNLSNALVQLLNHEIQTSDAETVEDLIEIIKRTEDTISQNINVKNQ